MTLRILNQRGQALAYTAIALVALLGLTFLAINVAYLSHVASEAQAAADAIATYGATVVADAITDPTQLEARTDAFAPQSSVAGQALAASEVTTVRGYYNIVNNTFSPTSLPSGQVWNAVHTTVTKNLTGSGFFAAQWLPFWSFVAPTTFTKEAYALMPAPSPGCNPNTFTSDLPLGLGDCAVQDGQSFSAVPDGICHPLSSWTTTVNCDDKIPNTQKKKAWWAGYEDGTINGNPTCVDARHTETYYPRSATCTNGLTTPRGPMVQMSTTAISTGKNSSDEGAAVAPCINTWLQTQPAGKLFNVGMFNCTTPWNAEWCDADPYNPTKSCANVTTGKCTYDPDKTAKLAYPRLTGCAVVQIVSVGTKTLNLKVVSWTAVKTPGAGKAETGGVRSRLVQPIPGS
jgi:Flp pilus assembly protein TadG